jgi:glycosyltransferase involved in cell wall biosynthesis
MHFRKRNDLILIKNISSETFPPELTIVIPVFNKEKIVQMTLHNLMENLTINVDLIIIDDCSEDNTSREIISWLDSPLSLRKNVQNVKFFQSRRQLFETKCDDFAFREARTKFAIELQADMQIQEHGFDGKLLKAMSSRSDFLAISGRGCHSFEIVCDSFRRSMGAATFDDLSLSKFIVTRPKELVKSLLQDLRIYNSSRPVPNMENSNQEYRIEEIFPSEEIFSRTGSAGKLGHLIEFDVETPAHLSNTIWVGDTVMRGPLIVDLEKYFALGGFRLEHFFLGYDEHDLFLRGSASQYLCGYLPLKFDSPLNTGSSRSHRSFFTQILIFNKIISRWPKRKETALYQHGAGAVMDQKKSWGLIRF